MPISRRVPRSEFAGLDERYGVRWPNRSEVLSRKGLDGRPSRNSLRRLRDQKPASGHTGVGPRLMFRYSE